MRTIKKLYNTKLVLTVTLLFIICLSAFFIGYIKFNEPELNENRLLDICGIYVDNEHFLYISTNMGVLVYKDATCVGRIDVSTYLCIAVENDIIYMWDYNALKKYAFEKDGSVAERSRTDVYPTERFQSDTYTKDGLTYRIHRILGYSYVTEGGNILYHSPIGEYLTEKAMYLLIPCFAYLNFGFVVVYGIMGGRDKKIKDFYKAALQELLKK